MRAFNSTLVKPTPVKRKAAKRLTPNLYFNVNTVEDYLLYAQTDTTQDFLFNLTLDTIKYGLAENKDVVDIFTLRSEDPTSKHNTAISLHKEEWKPVLNKAIKFYSKLNQYEKCIDCQQLISSIV